MKKKVVIFDSSVWLSYVLKNDMNHKNASSIFDDCIPKYKIIMPQIVFYEVTTVLLKLNEISALSEFLDFDFEIISLDNDLFLKYAFLYKNIYVQKPKTY